MPRVMKMIACVLLLVLACTSQNGQEPAPFVPDAHEITKETQQTLRSKGFGGLIWWIPVEFWEASQGGGKSTVADSLRGYTTVAVVVAKVGPFANFDFVQASELRKNVRLRGEDGHEYAPLEKVSSDAAGLSAMMRPMLKNALGVMGESVEFLFFPAKDGKGAALADPKQKGKFAIVLRDISGQPEDVYDWTLPLTSLSPPKFCPVGKERVQANWNYCPWHGNKL